MVLHRASINPLTPSGVNGVWEIPAISYSLLKPSLIVSINHISLPRHLKHYETYENRGKSHSDC